MTGKASLIKLLLESDVDLELKNEDGCIALTISWRSCVRLLLKKGASSESLDYLGRTAFHYAASQSNCAILTSLADYNPQ